MDKEEKKTEPQYVQLQVVKNERTYRFLIPVGAPLGEAFDSALEISRQIVNLAQQAVQVKDESNEDKPKE